MLKKNILFIITDPYHFEKYDSKTSYALEVWSWFQIIITLLFASYLFYNIATIGSPDMFIYGGFIFLSVYAYTELMDKNSLAIIFEIIKNGFGLYTIFLTNDWFKLSSIIPYSNIFLAIYFILSTIITSYFVKAHTLEKNL